VNWAIIWTILAIGLAIVEALTFGLTTIWFAAGALIALLFNWLGFNVYIQVVAFIVSSIGLLLLTRPFVVNYMKVGNVKTNVDSLVGKRAIVMKTISEHSFGQVKLAGQMWTAKSQNGKAIVEGSEVVVDSIEGVKLVVKEEEK
jgi:membrane protein implicated in regulation of membrane protease activity